MILGLDIGGTNVDTVVIEKGEVVALKKTPVDQENLLDTILNALTNIISDIDTSKLERIVLSTTITTNAIVQSSNNKVGVIVESGPGRKLNLTDDKLIPYFVDGYIDHRGRERYSLDPEQIKRVKNDFDDHELDFATIVSKFSVRNPEHEEMIADYIEESVEYLTMGHKISGELNFPRRINTAFLNSSVYKKYNKFVEAVEDVLTELKIDCPVYVLKADGGNMLLDKSMSIPVETILSGPAASIMGGKAFARGKRDFIVIDVGGTTTDISFFADGIPLYERRGVMINHYKTLVKGLYSRSIGIGGDSRVFLKNNNLKIGPESVCPAIFSGQGPTPTDAMCVLGYIPEGDKEKAIKVLEPYAAKLNLNVRQISKKILNKFAKIIINKSKKYLKQVNSQPVYTIHDLLHSKKIIPERAIIIGGPASVIEEYISKFIDYPTIVPDYYQVANSVGAALSRVTAEMNLTADTSQGYILFGDKEKEKIENSFDLNQAKDLLFENLLNKAKRYGFTGNKDDLYMVEEEEFNIVRKFNTRGKFYKIKARVKPGLKEGYLNGKSEK